MEEGEFGLFREPLLITERSSREPGLFQFLGEEGLARFVARRFYWLIYAPVVDKFYNCGTYPDPAYQNYFHYPVEDEQLVRIIIKDCALFLRRAENDRIRDLEDNGTSLDNEVRQIIKGSDRFYKSVLNQLKDECRVDRPRQRYIGNNLSEPFYWRICCDNLVFSNGIFSIQNGNQVERIGMQIYYDRYEFPLISDVQNEKTLRLLSLCLNSEEKVQILRAYLKCCIAMNRHIPFLNVTGSPEWFLQWVRRIIGTNFTINYQQVDRDNALLCMHKLLVINYHYESKRVRKTLLEFVNDTATVKYRNSKDKSKLPNHLHVIVRDFDEPQEFPNSMISLCFNDPGFDIDFRALDNELGSTLAWILQISDHEVATVLSKEYLHQALSLDSMETLLNGNPKDLSLAKWFMSNVEAPNNGYESYVYQQVGNADFDKKAYLLPNYLNWCQEQNIHNMDRHKLKTFSNALVRLLQTFFSIKAVKVSPRMINGQRVGTHIRGIRLKSFSSTPQVQLSLP
jgi:hypothetical protein